MVEFVFYGHGLPHHGRAYNLIKAGLWTHGIQVIDSDVHTIMDAPVAITWGARLRSVWEHQKRRGGRVLVMERGYFGSRMAMTSMGWCGLNGRADFCNQHSPPDRWIKHGPSLADWKTGGNYVLITGQVPGDAAVEGRNLEADYAQIAETLKDLGMHVKYRPHPGGGGVAPPNVEITTGTLAEDLAGASCVVTINSNSATDAVIAGVPAVTLDPGAMAWPVAGHELAHAVVPVTPDRYQWACDLAYCQWTDAEISDGTFWRTLSRGYHP